MKGIYQNFLMNGFWSFVIQLCTAGWLVPIICDVRSLTQQCRIAWHKTGILSYITVYNSLMNGSFMTNSYSTLVFYGGLYKLKLIWLGEKCSHRVGSKIHELFPHRKLQWRRALQCANHTLCCHFYTLYL